FKSFD
ncbi:unnamed protein product, partial [Allacma fusca]